MYIQLEGQVLYYEIEGEGTPMILLHGNGEDHTIFDKLVEAWKDTYKMYLIDSRGHGLSATPEVYHYHEMAADVVRFIQALDIERPIILGFSDGGIQALMIGIFHSNLVSELIVCGANTNPYGLSRLERWAIKKEYKRTKDMRRLLMLGEPDITDDDLRQISAPTIVVAGGHDCIMRSHTEHIANTIPNAQLIILQDDDHSGYIVHSDKLSKVLMKR